MSREDGYRSFWDRIVQLINEDRSSVAELLDDVLVVDDLLAHVNRRAVGLERALDRLNCAVNAGAVAARSGEQDFVGSIHLASVYEELATAHLVDQCVNRFAGHIERPWRNLAEVVGQRVAPRVLKVDQVDRGDSAFEKWCVVVVDRTP